MGGAVVAFAVPAASARPLRAANNDRVPLRVDILTTFPGMFGPGSREVLAALEADRAAQGSAADQLGRIGGPLGYSIPARAAASGAVEWLAHDLRAFTADKHHKTDDRPFGGGPGMVMACQPVWDAVHAVEGLDARSAARVYLTPQGRRLDQATVEELSTKPRLLLLCGHYEGIDERVIERLAPLEVSVGDFVLSGGELAAMVLMDAVVRLLPGVLGDEGSHTGDSFGVARSYVGVPGTPRAERISVPDGQRLLDCPHYTKPREWMGMSVPDVLLSGDHGAVERWRLEQRLTRTRQRRPDLLGQ